MVYPQFSHFSQVIGGYGITPPPLDFLQAEVAELLGGFVDSI
jgi:hypothetical protein